MVIHKSSSTSSSRERWVKALLPAAIAFAVYMLLFNLTIKRSLQSVQEELKDSLSRAVTEDAVASAFVRKKSAERKVDDLYGRIDQVQVSIDRSLAVFTEGAPAVRTMQVDGMCRELSIVLLNQKTAASVAVSKMREKSLRTLHELAPQEVITYRQLDVVAKYGDMMTLLDWLPKTVDGLVPLGIELLKQDEKAGPSKGLVPGQRIWRLYLLM